MPCRVELFGGIKVSNGASFLTSFQVKECGLILAYLTFYPNRPFPADYLAEIFWPHRYCTYDPKYAPELGLSSFRKALSCLRIHLRKDLGLDPDSILAKGDATDVDLDGDHVHTDVGEFNALVRAAKLAIDTDLRIQRLTDALDLYKGELLRGMHLVWVVIKREELENNYYGALQELVTLLSEKNDWDRAKEICRRAIDMDSLREWPHRLLMEVFDSQGKLQAALDHFRLFENLQRKPADALPTSDLRRYARDIQDRLNRGETARPGNSIVSSDDTRQLSKPLPLQSGDTRVNTPLNTAHIEQLPPEPNQFIGRENEFSKLQSLLEKERLVTLVGPAGVGKTRLGLAIARRLSSNYSTTVFVPLENVSDANQILQEIANKIGLPCPFGFAPLQQVMSALAGRPALVVLDNFEHLAETGAETVVLLRNALPKLTCLITSRKELAFTETNSFAIEPLITPSGRDPLHVIVRNDCARLFAERAKVVLSEFEITDENAHIVAEICDRLKGLPLAIELAAAQVKSVDLSSMRDQIREHLLDFLVKEKVGGDPRHRTLRAAFNWSYQLLKPPAQAAFARLCVFRGGWTRAAAKEICKVESFTLDELVKSSMVVKEPATDENAEYARFHMLEIVREFAEELLPAKNSDTLESNQAEFYIDFVGRSREGMRGNQAGEWLGLLEADHNNIRRVLDVMKKKDPEAALRFAICLPLFWDLRGHWQLGYSWLSELLRRNPDADPQLQAEALIAAGNLAYRLGKTSFAARAFLQCIEISRAEHLRQWEGKGLNNQGILHKEQGRFREAAENLNASLRIKQELGDDYGEALTLTNLGNLYFQQNEFALARSYLERALPILGELKMRHVLANALNNLGGVTRAEADWKSAQALLATALRIRCEIEDRNGQAYSFDEFARLAQAQGMHVRAAHLSAAAQAVRAEKGFRLTPVEQECHDEFMEDLSEGLGAEEFGREWSRGSKLTADQAVSLARQELFA